MAINLPKLKTTLNSSKTQRENNALYQTILGLIQSAQDGLASFLTITQFQSTIASIRFIQVFEIDTSGGPVNITLSDYIANNFYIFKDTSGNAGANNITLTGTVDGVANPVINTNYGLKQIYRSIIDGNYYTW